MADDTFAKMVTEEPDREELEEELDLNIRSASQQEESSPNDSDLESTLKRLFPTFDNPEIKQVAQIIMLGRVFPENFSIKVYLLVTSIAMRHYNDPDFDVILTMMTIEGICQVGLEGKGRVEAVIISGNTKEQAEQESSKGSF